MSHWSVALLQTDLNKQTKKHWAFRTFLEENRLKHMPPITKKWVRNSSSLAYSGCLRNLLRLLCLLSSWLRPSGAWCHHINRWPLALQRTAPNGATKISAPGSGRALCVQSSSNWWKRSDRSLSTSNQIWPSTLNIPHWWLHLELANYSTQAKSGQLSVSANKDLLKYGHVRSFAFGPRLCSHHPSSAEEPPQRLCGPPSSQNAL